MNLFFLFLLPIASLGLQKLTKDTINDFLSDTTFVRGIMFHVSWCGACKKTLPEFEAAAKTLVGLAEFDCTDDGEYCANEWGVHYYPQLRFTSGKNLWFVLPRYERTKDGIVDFVRRIESTAPIVASSGHHLHEILNDKSKRNGLYISVLLIGDWSESVEIFSRLRIRYHFVSVSNKDWLPLDMKFADQKYALMVVDKSVLVPGTWGEYPRFHGGGNPEFISWLDSTPLPGIWKVEESLFQLFNDQSVFKVLISQDPAIAASNKTIQSAVADCLSPAVRASFSFGIVNGPGFATALSEFGVSQNLGILVLGKEALDFSLYYTEEFESVSDDLCAGLGRILDGSMTPQYRGSLFSRWNYKYTRLLKKYGMDTELWRVGILISLIGILIFGLVAGAGYLLRDIDDKKND